MKKTVMFGTVLIVTLTAIVVTFGTSGCGGSTDKEVTVGESKSAPALLCKMCGEIKGTDKCCKAEGREKCAKCGLFKGSPGCCKIGK